MKSKSVFLIVLFLFFFANFLEPSESFVSLDPPDTVPGYLAYLLINETPFPGEWGYTSEEDTKAAMLQILWVLHSRLKHIPDGYQQEEIAAVRSQNIVDIITAGGEKQQCDGFYRDKRGRFTFEPRVRERVEYLVRIANKGQKRGKFSNLLNYAQGLARSYMKEGIGGADRFAGLEIVNKIRVTGRAYSWMSGCDFYSPGGNFVAIPDTHDGILGGNRFFTLRKDHK